MIQEPKKAAMLILAGRGKKDQEAPEKPELEESGDEGLTAAAEDLISAVKESNPKGVVAALRSFYDQCEAKESDGED